MFNWELNRRYISHSFQNALPFRFLRTRVFGVVKPAALSLRDWDKWRTNTKHNHPVCWLATEKLPRMLDVTWHHTGGWIRDVCNMLYNGLIEKPHSMSSNLPRGKWHSSDTRMLHCNFQVLVDYIEIECAGSYARNNWINWWLNPPRDPKRGLSVLRQEYSLCLEDGVYGMAKEVLSAIILYSWWVSIRPNRVDLTEASGLKDFYDRVDAKYNTSSSTTVVRVHDLNHTFSKEEREERSRLHKIYDSIETEREQEDEEMLIRLIKLRGFLCR